MELLGMLPVMEDQNLEQEKDSSEDKMGHEDKGLETLKKQCKDLEERLQRITSWFQNRSVP
jgi:molecular chaperone GrpE (heat shock protein)